MPVTAQQYLRFWPVHADAPDLRDVIRMSYEMIDIYCDSDTAPRKRSRWILTRPTLASGVLPSAILKAGSWHRWSRSLASSYSGRNRKIAGEQNVREQMLHACRIAGIGDKRRAIPSCFSAWASSRTPASEVIFPPSNAAVTFLPEMTGNAGKTGAISVMAVAHFLSSVSDRFIPYSLHDIRWLRSAAN